MIKLKVRHVVWIVTALFVALLLGLCWKIYRDGVPTKVKSIADGNTLVLVNGKKVGLYGLSIVKGSERDHLIKQYLEVLLDDRNVWLEYKNNLAKVWVGCESTPKFWPFRNERKPMGCDKGVLVNEQIAKIDLRNI